MKITVVTVLLWIGLSIGISVSVSWALLINHAVLPHRGALHKEWFQQHLDQDKEWRRIHTAVLRELHRDMKQLLTRILEKP